MNAAYMQCNMQVEFEKPDMNLDALMRYGKMLVDEQENVQRVQLAEAYLSGAELAGLSGKSIPDEIIRKAETRRDEKERKEAAAGPGLLS